MAEHFDVIVVGARCAGSPLATLLARGGVRVCLVDRSRFPSDTASTHGVQPSGVKVLDRLGVLERLLEVTPPIDRGTIAFDDARTEPRGFSELFGAPMLSPRRVTLDAILLDAAAAAGVEVRTGTPVTGLVWEGARVAGVETRSGVLWAPLVVGADGVRSAVARLVGAAKYHETSAGRIFTWAYFEGARDDGRIWLGKVGDHAFLANPTDNGLYMAAVVPSADRRDEVLADREAAYLQGLAHWPELQTFLGGARRVGPIRVMSRCDGFFRQSAGPGWVLVGDAGHFKDPTPGQGISDALRQAVALAAAIEDALGAEGDGDRALHDWWRWRDRDAWEMYWFAHDMGAAGSTPPVRRQLQRRMVADPKLTNGLLRVLNHEVAPSRVFTPTMGLAATSKVLLTGRGRRREAIGETRALMADRVRRRAPAPPSPAAPHTSS